MDITRPSVARGYDFYLGGSHNFESDREFVQKVLAVLPDLPKILRENRDYLQHVVRHLSTAGIDQFLDLGSGIPTVGNVHEVAQQVNPQARVVYVDNDPIAVTHSRRLLTDDDQTTVVDADIRNPDGVLADPAVHTHLNLDRPVAVLLVAVLHFIADDEHPAAFISDYMHAVGSGSYLVISHGSTDGQPVAAAGSQEIFNRPGSGSPGPMRLRSREEITALFGDLTIIEPGVVRTPQWRPDAPGDVPTDIETYPGFAGVGRHD